MRGGRAHALSPSPLTLTLPPPFHPPTRPTNQAGEAETAEQRASRLEREAEARRAAAGERVEEARRREAQVCVPRAWRGVCGEEV